LEHREQPESNPSVDRAAVFRSLGIEPVRSRRRSTYATELELLPSGSVIEQMLAGYQVNPRSLPLG